jgi:glycosyltransferase involved in cell wall biosynthesis
MRILQTPVRVFTTGGVEHYVLSLSRALADLGHDIEILASDEPGSLSIPENLKVVPLPYLGKIANTNITPSLPFHLWKEDADIIHTHIPTPWSADWSSIIARVKKIPLVLNYYNDISGKGIHSHIASAYNHTFLKVLLANTKVIIVNRPHFISPHLKAHTEKIRIIPPGVDIRSFHPDSSPPEWDIFFLSVLDRYHHYKGLDTLLSALSIVKKTNPGVNLLIGGTGELLEDYRRMAQDMGIGPNVKFAGYIPYETLRGYYSRSRLFVLPSSDPHLEGFGMVTLEAMACGRPVITTRVSGVAGEIETSGAGVILDPGNPERLAEIIRNLLDDEKKMNEMGRAGRDLVEKRFSWERIAKVIEGAYKEILG